MKNCRTQCKAECWPKQDRCALLKACIRLYATKKLLGLLGLRSCGGATSLEFFYAAGSIYDLIVPRVKRMACRTDFYVYRLFGRADGKSPAARAGNFCLRKIGRMHPCFHEPQYNPKSEAAQAMRSLWQKEHSLTLRQ